ncbi:MAG TPA: Ig-like domain-containing protein [Candidatus Elarobacter sp.]|nr:Ig-like domain-containing protein [Candidatus Elarobacter sp.]
MRRRASRLLPFLCALACGVTLVGCGGAGSSGVASQPPGGIGIPCPALALDGPALLSPAPGSTGVPVTLAVLTFAHIVVIPDIITGNATLSGSDGSKLTSGPLTPSSDLSTTTASIAGLQPHTTYTVSVSGNLNERGCMFPFSANDGSFTTQ